jgi:hypothetical protein
MLYAALKGRSSAVVRASRVGDAQGDVTGYTYHRDDGQEIHAKETK